MVEKTTRPLTDSDRVILARALEKNREQVVPYDFPRRHYWWTAVGEGFCSLILGLIPAVILYQFPLTRPYVFALVVILFLVTVATSPSRTARFIQQQNALRLQDYENESAYIGKILESGTVEIIHVTAYGAIKIAPPYGEKGCGGEYLIDVGNRKALFIRGDYRFEFVESRQKQNQSSSTATEWKFELEQPLHLFYQEYEGYEMKAPKGLPLITQSSTRIIEWRSREAHESITNCQVLDGVSLATLESDLPMLFKRNTDNDPIVSGSF